MRLPALAVLPLLCACGGAAQLRLDDVRRIAATARERGAYRCAPEALARAEAYADFARVELQAGELIRAEGQLERGEQAAVDALRHAQACLAVVLSPRPAPAPPPKKTDRDGDGIVDEEDRCPDEPEDA
jgi:hypothetical protein